MPLSNLWNRIIEWFQDRNSRNELIRDFNKASKSAYVQGVIPTILEASVTMGCREYRHQFSNIMYSGFRIKAYSGRQLTRDEMVTVGEVVVNNPMLVRRLVVLGWDTLEVTCDSGNHGCRWQLHDYIALG